RRAAPLPARAARARGARASEHRAPDRRRRHGGGRSVSRHGVRRRDSGHALRRPARPRRARPRRAFPDHLPERRSGASPPQPPIRQPNPPHSRGPADGTVKLLDFGIAKLVADEDDAPTVAAFTPEYAAPEQLAGKAVTTATDVYALGLLFSELMLGARCR